MHQGPHDTLGASEPNSNSVCAFVRVGMLYAMFALLGPYHNLVAVGFASYRGQSYSWVFCLGA